VQALRDEFKTLLRLAWPVVLAQVGSMAIGLVDTWMVGRLGSRELSAVAIADMWIFSTLILGIGLVMGIDPLVSQAHGAGRHEDARHALHHGMLVALVATPPLAVLWWWTGPILAFAGQDPDLLPLASAYARGQIFSIAPFLLFTAMRQYLQACGCMLPPLLAVVVANVVNAFLNWVLIFGHWGFEARGVRGAAIATGITRCFLVLALGLLLWRSARLTRGFVTKGLGRVLRLGRTTAIQLGLEVWGFAVFTSLAGLLRGPAVAAHVIVLKIASFTFMVPLGISVAASTRVGNLLGAQRPADAQRSAWIAIAMGVGAMAICAVCLLLFGRELASVFTSDAAVVALATAIFPIAGAFQLFDGTQVVGGGVLRGMGIPRPAALFNLVGYYLCALPLGYWLGFGLDHGLVGLWWGICAGLGLIALLLVAYIRFRGPAAVSGTASTRW